MNPSLTMKMTLELPIVVTPKEKWYVAACPALDVVSQGESAEEAKKHLAEALHLFLVSCLERGNLEAVLKECGFSPLAEAPSFDPASVQDKIDIPLYLLAKFSESCQCHHG
jgi:predicted RNase H-like HicB family nuclease